MKRFFNQSGTMLISLLLMSGFSTPVLADDYDAENLIEYRQESMEAIKHTNNAIKLILKGKVPYDDQLALYMDNLETLFGQIGTWFPEGSDFGETNAKDGIWDNPEKFEAAVDKAQKALADFKAVVAKGDKGASAKAMKSFGKNSCGNCHKSFKKKDD